MRAILSNEKIGYRPDPKCSLTTKYGPIWMGFGPMVTENLKN